MHPQVPAEQRDIDDVPEELGWHEGRCPDCAEREADVPLSDTPMVSLTKQSPHQRFLAPVQEAAAP